MKIKVDTKEKFTVLTLNQSGFTAIMAEELTRIVRPLLNQDIKNVIIDFHEVQTAEQDALICLADLHRVSYNQNASFVLCELNEVIRLQLVELKIDEVLNITPSQTEAWDIVQMEEIERELFGNEE